MADEEYLEIIRHGVDAWNEWKAKNPNSRPELDDVNFCSAQLSSVNLPKAHLPRVVLYGPIFLTQIFRARTFITWTCVPRESVSG
jgi:hypothetical protein